MGNFSCGVAFKEMRRLSGLSGQTFDALAGRGLGWVVRPGWCGLVVRGATIAQGGGDI